MVMIMMMTNDDDNDDDDNNHKNANINKYCSTKMSYTRVVGWGGRM